MMRVPPAASLIARLLAATVGAYALTALATMGAALLLAHAGMGKAEAIIAATIASFALFAMIAMTAFHSRSASRAWLGLAVAALPMALIVWVG